MTSVLAYDGITANVSKLPAGQHAGYTTGSSIIKWTDAQWQADPGAIRIDQDPGATDHTADVLDVESGAATIADISPWLKDAYSAFESAARPGQRMPLVYVSGSNLAAAGAAIVASGVPGAHIWLADPDITLAEAEAKIGSTVTGAVKIQGVQYAWEQTYDVDVFNSAWLSGQSGVAGDTVAEGNSGPAVLALQKALAADGQQLTEDGLFGPATLAAVKAFQTAKKLSVDGVAGPQTWSALKVAPPAPKPAPAPAPPAITWSQWPASATLQQGSTGAAVKVLQTACRDSGMHGVRGITVDGDFGPQTLTAVRNFQAAKKLTVDGIAGPQTRAALKALNDL